ncbi:MAG: hypothetical protein KF727_14505 [Microbacteriaceae bacterium]|nr:hypothetical protein [Microbacteriaceae bacterium]
MGEVVVSSGDGSGQRLREAVVDEYIAKLPQRMGLWEFAQVAGVETDRAAVAAIVQEPDGLVRPDRNRDLLVSCGRIVLPPWEGG